MLGDGFARQGGPIPFGLPCRLDRDPVERLLFVDARSLHQQQHERHDRKHEERKKPSLAYDEGNEQRDDDGRGRIARKRERHGAASVLVSPQHLQEARGSASDDHERRQGDRLTARQGYRCRNSA